MARTLSLKGEWKPGLAGGCPKYETYGANPSFVLAPSMPASFTIELTQPADAPARLPIGLVILNRDPSQPFKPKLSSKRLQAKTNYKASLSQSLTINLEPAAAGKSYVVLCSTFEPDQYGTFALNVSSEEDPAFTLQPVTAAPVLAGGVAASGAGGSTKLPVAPPGAPTGKLRPADDATLSAAIAAMREAGGPFDDPEFKVKFADQPKDKAINGKLLYTQGHPSKDSIKVDAYSRLSEMGGKGPATAAASNGSAGQIVYRRGLGSLRLLGAIGMVSTRQDLLERLVAYQDESAGLAALRFFKDGKWKTVVVDDQMPCHGKAKLAYSSNDAPRDGPVCLAMKGLAKLYGCYEHLKGGRVGSALEDLTGGFKDKIYLRDGVRSGADQSGPLKQPDINVQEELASGVLWARLGALHEGGHLLGAVFKPKYASLGGSPAIDPSVLDANEALVYPVIGMKEVSNDSGGGRYVKLRNPFSKIGDNVTKAKEWEGPWGSSRAGAAEWSAHPGVASELGGKPRDPSTFWMSFEDFVSGFNKVHVCRLAEQSSGWLPQPVVHGEWTPETAGGKVGTPPGPGALWRRNPQYFLTLPERCTVIVAVAQPDALLDANDDVDGYVNKIGFSILSADKSASGIGGSKLLLSPDELRFDSRLSCTRQVSAAVELEAGEYNLIPYTEEPQTFMPYILSVSSSSAIGLKAVPKAKEPPTIVRGKWSASGGTAGGCPNHVDTWTSNPQFVIKATAACKLVGVLALDVDNEAEANAMEAATLQLTEAITLAQQQGDSGAEQAAQAQLAALAPPIGFIVLRKQGSAGLSGPKEVSKDDIVASSAYVHGTQEVASTIELPSEGEYLLITSTFEPQQEGKFVMNLFTSSDSVNNIGEVKSLTKGCEVVDKARALKAGGARPQGHAGPPGGAGGKSFAPPAAKHDVAATRAESGDDGKMGYAQRMELEEEQALKGWVENVPMMTIEGQPLSENVKKRRDACIKQAMDHCRATGRKFTDTTFPKMEGRAQSEVQEAIYRSGRPSPGMPSVTQWLRPEEFVNLHDPRYKDSTAGPRQPLLWKSLWEVEGIIQGAAMDNRWFISALNIVAGNRGQLDRIFFGEVDPTWVTYGFFVCKFYQDDPMSDDDWQVILVDDRIPCDSNGHPVFCRHPDQRTYWGMIIEKAYAKFAGCYEAMQGGTVTQGLEDLTGGIGYKFDLAKREKEWIPPKGEVPERLWDEMMEKMKTEHVIGVTNNTKGEPRPNTTKKGIMLNRAYAVVTGGDFEDRKLMRLRIPLNPDGTAKEWNGPWSDKSGQWNTRMMQMLHYSRDEQDGTFWMEYKDLCRHFNKVYMCRMLDDLWTRFAVKSRWMDETAGGCTNFISWRNNNQWLLRIDRPATKLIIKLTQPDARKSMGNGRHYSNAIGFYILKGNDPNKAMDQLRRKLILKDGDEEDGGDFVFTKEPRYSRQVCVEYMFENANPTPYVLLPFMFEPGREALFKLTILSDDRDDDGEADFGFTDVKPEDDWKRTSIIDAWSNGGEGNALGTEMTAGGPVNGPAKGPKGQPLWLCNTQYQISLIETTRCFIFLEMLNVKTDMRDVEGLQTEPDYPTVGFVVCKGRGNHTKLDTSKPLEILFTKELKRGDGVYLELGALDAIDDRYVVIPYTDKPNVEHKFNLMLYTDYEHDFVKIDPRLNCDVCGNKNGLFLVEDVLDKMMKLSKRVHNKEHRMIIGDDGTNEDWLQQYSGPPAQPTGQMGYGAVPISDGLTADERKFQAADADGDGLVSEQEAQDYLQYHAAADTDGDGKIDLKELVKFLKPIDDNNQMAAQQQNMRLAELDAVRQQQLVDMANLKQQLNDLGVTDEQMAAAVGNKNSSLCSVM